MFGGVTITLLLGTIVTTSGIGGSQCSRTDGDEVFDGRFAADGAEFGWLRLQVHCVLIFRCDPQFFGAEHCLKFYFKE